MSASDVNLKRTGTLVYRPARRRVGHGGDASAVADPIEET